MKLTGHKTAAIFHRYNTVDAGGACQKWDTLLSQEGRRGKAAALKQGKCSHRAPE
jgi:hypothetical protein